MSFRRHLSFFLKMGGEFVKVMIFLVGFLLGLLAGVLLMCLLQIGRINGSEYRDC